MTITLQPMLAMFGLGGWAIILILIALMFPVVLAAIVVRLFMRGRNKRAGEVPNAIKPPTQPPVQPAPRKCPQCGADLKPDAPEGLCPACLLKRGIATEGGVPPGTPPFTPPSLADLAKLFPQLEILEPIGQGGMGAVYKARQPALDRFVALKILAPRGGGDLDFAGRFTREARALAKLSHPNIVAVHDFGQVSLPSTLDPRPLNYFLMEYVDGPNLRQVEQAGKLTPREALQIIPQICAALQFAHDEGIVHRDIKPENILLDKKGRVKIADFGLAKILGQDAEFRLTGARDIMGTPHYMAPEQVEKPQEVDHRADIYSLGVVFYEMLTGELPLGKFDPPSHRAQIDVRLDEVVLRSLAKSPERRYQHVSEVKTELESIATTPNPIAGSANRVSRTFEDIDYRSRATLFGLPLLHVAAGVDPKTGKVRVAKGIIAIGGRAKGVVAIGGMATGGIALGGLAIGVFAFGGGAIGLFAFGGLAIALMVAIGGGAVAPLALGGGAIGFYAYGGGAIGYYAYGGAAIGAHVFDYRSQDPQVAHFFEPWAGRLMANLQVVNAILVVLVVGIGAGVPLWIRMRMAKNSGTASGQSGPRPADGRSRRETVEPLPRFQAIAFTVASVLMALLLLSIGWVANQMGLFFNALFLFILLMVPVRILLILWHTFHGTVEYRLWRAPFAPELGKYRWRVVNRWIFWVLAAVVLQICIVPAEFNSEQLSTVRLLTIGGVAVLILLELLPPRRSYLATNAVYAIGSIFMAVQIARIYWPESKAQAVVLSMPVRGDWLVVNGGNSSLINIHFPFKEQRNAVDMEKLVDGHERTGDAHKLESYPSWGETVYAPADGKVVVAQSNLDDNVVGEMDRDNPVGNHICIDMGNGHYVMLAHLQKSSLKVAEGDTVHTGQPLAKCGNSGNTSNPHLHIQVQDAPRIFVTGRRDATTYPILFRDASRVRAEQTVGGAPFFVRRNDQMIREAEAVKKNEPPKIILKGITTILGVKKALLTVPGPGPGAADENLMLAEGQSQYDIAVNQIDQKAGVVKVDNHGVSQTLVLDHGAAPASDRPNQTLIEQPPVVVETVPASGAQNLPPGETEIRVRFSKVMTDRSWNWSNAWENSAPEFLGDPHYLGDGRTCVLKVRLEPGRTYGIWLTSETAKNFKDQQGRSAVPYLLTFQTQNK